MLTMQHFGLITTRPPTLVTQEKRAHTYLYIQDHRSDIQVKGHILTKDNIGNQV